MNLPITAISQMLQTTMHFQQFVTSLALKGDAVFDRLTNAPEEQPEWATFDEDLDAEQAPSSTRASRFDRYDAEEPPSPTFTARESLPAEAAARASEHNGHTTSVRTIEPETVEPEPGTPIAATEEPAQEIDAPEVATRYDYAAMTLAQLRARLRMLTIEDLTALLDYEQQTRARAPFVTMLTNRIATVRAQ